MTIFQAYLGYFGEIWCWAAVMWAQINLFRHVEEDTYMICLPHPHALPSPHYSLNKPGALMPPWSCSCCDLGLERLSHHSDSLFKTKWKCHLFSVSYLDLSLHLTTISKQKTWFPLLYHLSFNIKIISLNVCLFLKTRDLPLLNFILSSPSIVSGTQNLRICEMQFIWLTSCLLTCLINWYSGKLDAWLVDWLTGWLVGFPRCKQVDDSSVLSRRCKQIRPFLHCWWPW